MFGKFNLANTALVGMSQAVSVRPERCSRMCHKNSACTLCETNCPTQAITVGKVGSKISVEWDKCSYCAICVNICPTGVYGVREMSYVSFLDAYLVKLSDDGVLKLSCKESVRQENEEKESGLPLRDEIDAVRTIGIFGKSGGENRALVECMGIFGLSDILYFYVNGARTVCFEFPVCEKCINRHGRAILEDEVEELKKLTEYFENLQGTQIDSSDREIKIVFPKQYEKKIISAAEEKAAKNAVRVTRRGMFDLMRQNAVDTALRSATLLTPQEIPNRTVFTDKKEVPIKRKVFLDALVNLGKLLKREAPLGPYFFSIEIDNVKCTFCKMCLRFCATGALSASEDGKSLLFTAAHCTSCGMCKISCYHKCIKPSKTVPLQDFFTAVVKYQKIDK